MKIVFFYLSQQGGGAALDTFELAVGLSKRAEVLCVVSSESVSYKVWKEEALINKNFHIIGVKTTKNMLKGLLSIFNYFKFWNIIKSINNFNPDVIYSHMSHPWEKIIIPRLKSKQVFKGVHDVRLHQGESSFKARVIRAITTYQSSYYVVFSRYSREQLIKQGINSDSIVETSLGCCKMLSTNATLDETYHGKFLFFGRLIKYKGIDVLFDSLDSVFEELPDIKLVIAGRGDISEYEEIINKHKNNLDIYNRWIEDDEVCNYYKDIDFVIAPYIDASQSGVVLLSYAYGKPVIVSNSGGLPEQVVDGKTGIIIPKADSKALSEAIIRLFKNKECLLRMKKDAFYFSNEMSWDAAANKLYNGICKLI